MLFGRAAMLPGGLTIETGVPTRVYERTIPTDWVDYNGHTNDSRYLQLASEASDRFLNYIGLDEAYLSSGFSWYTVETHVNYLDQSRAGDRVHVDMILVSADEKRLRCFFSMYRNDPGREPVLMATSEYMLLHVDTRAAKACPMPPSMHDLVQRVAAAHAAIERPTQVGRAVGQGR
jgi:acyl-CoA thioesterase FadM